jgi:transglutaminase-like putative cysteine protease
MRRISWFLLLASLAGCRPTPLSPDAGLPVSDASAPIQGAAPPSSIRSPGGAWYGVYLGGHKVGFAHLTRRLTDLHGVKAVVHQASVRMRAAFGGMQVEMREESERFYEASGEQRLLRVRKHQRQGSLVVKLEVQRQGDRMLVRREVQGREEERTLPASLETAQDDLFGGDLRRDLQAGQVLRGHLFFEETLKDYPVTVHVVASGLELVGGVPLPLTHVRVEGLPFGFRLEGRLTPQGELVFGTLGPMVLRLEGEDVARAPHTRTDLLDISPEVPRLAHRGGASVRLRIRGLRPSLARDDERQRFERLADGSFRVTLRRIAAPTLPSPSLPFTSPGLAPFLRPTSVLQSDHPEIRAAARSAVGDERNAWRAALRLREWVHRTIRPGWQRTLDALSALRAGRGMCYESAHVLAALARASGIPSRLAYGLIYSEVGGRARFVGHAWTELWVGQWIPFDATEAVGPALGPHLKLAGDGGEAEAVSALQDLRLSWE